MTSANQASRIGRAPEVAHVGVERLAAGDDEDDAAEHEEARATRGATKKRTAWIGLHRAEDRRVVRDLDRAERPPASRTRRP